jgi:hypothetical protein
MRRAGGPCLAVGGDLPRWGSYLEDSGVDHGAGRSKSRVEES